MRNISLAIILIILFLGSDAITGFSSSVSVPPDAQTFQSGVAQCQLVQTPSGMDTSGCTGTIGFPVAFSTIPTKFGISTQCMANTAQTLTGKTAEQVCEGLGGNQGHMSSAVYSYLHFESDNGQVWTSMPAATTEIYGTPNHEQTADLFGIQQAFFSVNVITVSSGATAFLRPQYLNGLGVWTDLAVNPGGLDVSVNFLPGPVNTGVTTIATGSQNFGQNLRIVGGGGGGVGDNPDFNEITLALTPNIALSVVPSIGCQFGNTVCVSTIAMLFWVTAINPLNGIGNLFPIFSWWACVC